MPFDVLSPEMLKDPFFLVWLLASVVILVVGVLMAFCIAAVCYKIVVAETAPRQPHNKRTTTTRQPKNAYEQRARRARGVLQTRQIGVQPHQPMIFSELWYI